MDRRSKQIKQGVTIIRVVTARAVGVQITSLDFTRLIFRRGDHNLNTAVTSSEPLSLIYICTRSKRRWECRDEGSSSWFVGAQSSFAGLRATLTPYPGKVHEYLGDLYMLIGKRQTPREHLTPQNTCCLFETERTNEVHLLLRNCLLRLLILKAMYFNGLKLVACGSIERRYFKQGCGLN